MTRKKTPLLDIQPVRHLAAERGITPDGQIITPIMPGVHQAAFTSQGQAIAPAPAIPFHRVPITTKRPLPTPILSNNLIELELFVSGGEFISTSLSENNVRFDGQPADYDYGFRLSWSGATSRTGYLPDVLLFRQPGVLRDEDRTLALRFVIQSPVSTTARFLFVIEAIPGNPTTAHKHEFNGDQERKHVRMNFTPASENAYAQVLKTFLGQYSQGRWKMGVRALCKSDKTYGGFWGSSEGNTGNSYWLAMTDLQWDSSDHFVTSFDAPQDENGDYYFPSEYEYWYVSSWEVVVMIQKTIKKTY